MSAATVDRHLKPDRDTMRIKGISTAKPSPLLRNSIRIRACPDKTTQVPEVTEADTMAHLGPTPFGESARALTMIDKGGSCSRWRSSIQAPGSSESTACWLPAVSNPYGFCSPRRASLPCYARKLREAPQPASRPKHLRHTVALTEQTGPRSIFTSVTDAMQDGRRSLGN